MTALPSDRSLPPVADHIYRCGVARTMTELQGLYTEHEVMAAVNSGDVIGIEILAESGKVRVRRYVPRSWLPAKLLEALGL